MISTTIATSGADYTSISGWEAGIANTDDETGTCTEKAQLGGGANITFNAANGGGYTYLLTADSASRVKAACWKECVRVAHSSRRFYFTTTGWEVDGIGYIFNNQILVQGTITVGFRNFLGRTTQIQCFSGASTIVLENVVILQGGTYCVYTNQSGSTINAYHCSFFHNSANSAVFATSSGTINCYGCISVNVGAGVAYNDASGAGTIGGDYNVADDTTGSSYFTNYWDSESPYLSPSTTTSEIDLTLTPAKRGSYQVPDYTGSAPNVGTDFYGTSRGSGYRDAGALQVPDTPTNTLLDNLVGFWMADEASAANDLADDTGSGYTLTAVSSPPVGTGMVSGCRVPDGSADYFTRTSDGTFALNGGGYVALWMWTDATTGTQDIVGKDAASVTNASWRLTIDSGLKFELCDGSARDGPTAGDDRYDSVRWLFVEIEYDSGTDVAKITVDRDTAQTTSSSMTGTGTIQAGSDDFRVAASAAGTRFFGGRVNGIGFWSSPPSTADRNALFNARHGLAYSDFTASSGGATFKGLTLLGVGGYS